MLREKQQRRALVEMEVGPCTPRARHQVNAAAPQLRDARGEGLGAATRTPPHAKHAQAAAEARVRQAQLAHPHLLPIRGDRIEKLGPPTAQAALPNAPRGVAHRLALEQLASPHVPRDGQRAAPPEARRAAVGGGGVVGA